MENLEGEVPRHRGDQWLESHKSTARDGRVYHRRSQGLDLQRQPHGSNAAQPVLPPGAAGYRELNHSQFRFRHDPGPARLGQTGAQRRHTQVEKQDQDAMDEGTSDPDRRRVRGK